MNRYEFRYSDTCNLCGSANRRILGRRLSVPQRWWPRGKIGIATTICRCRECGLIFANPLPIPESLADHYDRPPEQYWPENYFTEDLNYLNGQIGTFQKLARKPANGLTALDIGAGIGKGIKALARAGFHSQGIEASEPFRRMAIEKMGVPADAIRLSSVEEALFPDSSFDFILFTAVLEHLYDPALVLRKVVRWLKPDGLCVIEVPSSDYLMSRLALWYYRLIGTDYVINTCPMHPPYHLYEFTRRSFERNGKVAGYKVIWSQQYVCGSYLAWVGKAFDAIMHATGTGMQLEVWLQRLN